MIEVLDGIGVNVRIAAGSGRLRRRVFTLVQSFARHNTGTRPMTGKILEFHSRFQIEVAGDLFVNDDDLVIIGPLGRSGTEDIEAVCSHSNDPAGQRRSSRLCPGITGILESDIGSRNRVGRTRLVFDVLNGDGARRARGQPSHRQHDTFIVKSPAVRCRIHENVWSVRRRQSGHQTCAGHRDAAGESIINQRGGARLLDGLGEYDGHLCISAMPD